MNRDIIHSWIDGARDTADLKWGERSLHLIAHNEPDRAHTVLSEEVGEVARAILEGKPDDLVQELMDTIQVCVAWLEAL